MESDCYLLQAVAQFNHQDCFAIWSGCVDHAHCCSCASKAAAQKVQFSQQQWCERKLAKLMLSHSWCVAQGKSAMTLWGMTSYSCSRCWVVQVVLSKACTYDELIEGPSDLLYIECIHASSLRICVACVHGDALKWFNCLMHILWGRSYSWHWFWASSRTKCYCPFAALCGLAIFMYGCNQLAHICVSCSQQLQAWKLGPSHKITLAVLLLKWKACLEIVQGSWLSTRTSLHKPMAWPAHKKSMLGSRQSAHGTCNSRCDMCYCMSYTGRSLRCSFLYNA